MFSSFRGEYIMLKIFQKKKIQESTQVICPSCNSSTEVEKWNDIARHVYGEDSPEIRNAALNKKVSFPFQCPECHKGFSAYLLDFE